MGPANGRPPSHFLRTGLALLRVSCPVQSDCHIGIGNAPRLHRRRQYRSTKGNGVRQTCNLCKECHHNQTVRRSSLVLSSRNCCFHGPDLRDRNYTHNCSNHPLAHQALNVGNGAGTTASRDQRLRSPCMSHLSSRTPPHIQPASPTGSLAGERHMGKQGGPPNGPKKHSSPSRTLAFCREHPKSRG